MTSPAPRPETILRLRSAVFPSFALLAGIQLDLFTPLEDGPMRAEEIAQAIGVGLDKLGPLLYALSVAGLLTVEDGRFANNPEAGHFLVRGKPTYVGEEYLNFSQERWTAVLKTAESIRTGVPQAKVDFSTLPQADLELFYRSNYSETLAAGRDLASRFDFTARHRLLDIGGGTGGLSIAITEACPHLTATVMDLPNVTPVTCRFVDDAGATDRVQVIAADVVLGPLTGSFDVVVMRAIVPVLSPDDVRQALRNISQVLDPGGEIYVIDGGTLDNSRLSPPGIVFNNLHFINIFDHGQARTEQERRDWLVEASFEDIERVTLPNGQSIISARKPE